MKDILKAVVFGGLFAVPFLTLYVENDNFFPFITGKNFWFRIIVDVAFAAWVILALYEPKYRPKWSWIAGSFGILLVVMFFANLFGLHPETSFWSNFERMDGYVSLVHTFLYMLVLGSMLQSKQEWKYLLNTSLIVAFFVALYGLAQYGGLVDGSNRIDSRLGNAAYMAIYMLFHIFTAFWLFVETRGSGLKVFYGFLAVMFTFVLIETGTRGTAVGLVVGLAVMAAYIGLFGAKFKEYRKYAIGAIVLLAIGAGLFVGFRDSEFIQSNGNLARIANISLDDLKIRSIIWGMAWEGVQERPLLGHGQGNFNYIFNENYDPRLYGQEQWFDRAHNIFFDWLTAGGFLGLFAYLSIFAACGWYLFLRPLIYKDDEKFDVLERGILLGILAGYFTHNLVVFDNIISYIFFAILLGYIHSRVASPVKAIESAKVEESVITQFALPVTGVALVAVIYFWYMPGMQVASDIIDAFREPDPAARLEIFARAFERDSFARQELTEQLAQQTIQLTRSQVPDEVRQAYFAFTEQKLQELAEYKPGDARVHVFMGTYYRAINDVERAAAEMARARKLSPGKPAIAQQQGLIELTRGDTAMARTFFQEAFELDENNLEAREFYGAALFYVNEPETARTLIVDNRAAAERFAASDFVISAANQGGYTDFVLEMFTLRTEMESYRGQNFRLDPQNWASLAYLHYQVGNTEEALVALETGQALIPSFAPTAQCFGENIRNGREPQEGCE